MVHWLSNLAWNHLGALKILMAGARPHRLTINEHRVRLGHWDF